MASPLQGDYWSFSKKKKGFFMKTVTYHWTEMRVLELPDEYTSIFDEEDRNDYEIKRGEVEEGCP